MKIFIVIPTYNEKENIEKLVEKIFAIDPKFNIIIVDDNSPDGTGQIAKNLSQENSRVFTLHRPKKLGLGTAYVAGFKKALQAEADLVISMDADLSHNPKYLPEMIEKAKSHDLVIGSKYVPGGKAEYGLHRQILSKAANLFAKLFLGLKVSDATSGFRCYTKKVIEMMDIDHLSGKGYAFQTESSFLAQKLGLKITEIPIVFEDRKKGKAKMTIREMIDGGREVIKMRFRN